MTRLRAEALLLVITIVWGGTFAAIKTAVDDASAASFVFYRFGLALLISVLLWPRALLKATAKSLWRGLALGLLFGPGFVLQTLGLSTSTASTSAFITGTLVVFTPFAYWLIAGRRIRPLHLASAGAVFLGLWMFTAPDVKGFPLGDILTLIAAMQWAIYIVVLDRWTSSADSSTDDQHALVILQFAVSTVVAAIGMLVFDVGLTTSGMVEATSTTWSTELVFAVAYCALVASVFATWVQTRFQHYTHPVRAGVIYAMEPVAASFIAWITLQETWTVWQAIGASIMIAAVIIPDVLLARKGDS